MPNRLGLAYVAKKLAVGTKLAIDAIRAKKAKLVLLANDASDQTKKQVTDKAKYYKIAVNMKYDTLTLSKPIGRTNIKTIAILDEGFAKMYQ